jgi:thiol-disulfide isomerase/thioredoxin
MKTISVLIIFVLLYCSGCKISKPLADNKSGRASVNSLTQASDVIPPAANISEKSVLLLGYFNPDRLAQPPYSEWYITGFTGYQCNIEVLKKLSELGMTDFSIKIVLGTWCPDSRREVPRFMRLLSDWGFPVGRVNLIGVDDTKQSPVSEYGSLGIQKVPTFIIYKNNIEAGRIIENPTTSLEQDLLNILNGGK